MIRIDAMWLSAEPIDMRAGTERLLAHVVQVVCANRGLTRLPKFCRPPTDPTSNVACRCCSANDVGR